MESLYLLVPVSVALVFAAIWVFFHMSDSGQFDDMIGPSMRILYDDDSVHEVEEGGEVPAANGGGAKNAGDLTQVKSSAEPPAARKIEVVVEVATEAVTEAVTATVPKTQIFNEKATQISPKTATNLTP